MKLEETISLLRFLAEQFHQFKPTERTAAAWTITLADQELSAMLDAAARYSREGHAFPPAPGQLLQLAKRKAERPGGSEAWEVLRSAMISHSYMSPPNFADEKITRGVRFLGGWYNVSTMESDALIAARARFIEHYDSMVSREDAIDSRIDSENCLRLVDEKASEIMGGAWGSVKQLYGKNYSDDEDPEA